MEGKYKEQLTIAVDGTEHTVRTADNKSLHLNSISTPIEFERSPVKDLSPNKHKQRGPRKKYASASQRTRLMQEVLICDSKPKVRKVDSDEEDSDFECYDRSEGKPVNVDVDREITEGSKATLALLPNRSEEDEKNNNGETRDRDGNINLRRSNPVFKPSERLGSVPSF